MEEELELSIEKTYVLLDVLMERVKQDEKWGEQNHPNGTGKYGRLFGAFGLGTYQEFAEMMKAHVDTLARLGTLTYLNILLEEVFEAASEDDPVKLREELVQVMAVTMAWIEAIDRGKQSE